MCPAGECSLKNIRIYLVCAHPVKATLDHMISQSIDRSVSHRAGGRSVYLCCEDHTCSACVSSSRVFLELSSAVVLDSRSELSSGSRPSELWVRWTVSAADTGFLMPSFTNTRWSTGPVYRDRSLSESWGRPLTACRCLHAAWSSSHTEQRSSWSRGLRPWADTGSGPGSGSLLWSLSAHVHKLSAVTIQTCT